LIIFALAKSGCLLEYFAYAKFESGEDAEVESVKEMAHRGSDCRSV